MLVGAEVFAIHASSAYITRRPIKNGNLAINKRYSQTSCVSDLQTVIEHSLEKFLRLHKVNYRHFQIVLLVPSTLYKGHLRIFLEMLAKMHFKSILPILESVATTFAMGVPSGCIIDLGHS